MTEYDGPTERVEKPAADAFEQSRPVDNADAGAGRTEADPEEPDLTPVELPRTLPSDVDPADAYEQTRIVEYDEDDYR
ncbi:hypothetical protein [Phytoactinopolyspora limicola]|uniref:hypothetical protein n=1 Tax=Phytoactinopolyspora limicola TaxID=2715536 RepID=UPI00140C1CD6|nr:hypothetical protein [Phytoactinopolyspora limicola]